MVFVDGDQLGHALSDHAPSAAGRAYHVVAAQAAKAAFHPKTLLVVGPDGARLCVSSANLTPDGQLRNAESLIAFDSKLDGHLRPILDSGELFRRLSADAPPHTAAAVQAALAALPADDGTESGYTLVHNIDRPLIDTFPPTGESRAIAPYVDADGAAAEKLQERGELTVIVDAENVAASEAFFAGRWTIEARTFEARLHGKAYEIATPDGLWALVGSPNLSTPALLRPARSGNLEVAIAMMIERPLELPASTPSDTGPDLAQQAAARLRAAPSLSDEQTSAGRAFDAWEDEQRIIVCGFPDGTEIERWKDERWHPLGTLTDGAVLIPDPDVRPTRIRAVLPGGGFAFAVVSRPASLRARMKASTSGRQTESLERLPLDVETVRVLELALSHLYALSELSGEARDEPKPPIRIQTPRDGDQQQGLLEWMPRSPAEQPRVPSLYSKHWQGEPDALLALIGRVLRLERGEPYSDEDHLGREQIDIESLENVTKTEQVEVAKPEKQALPVEQRELESYRRAFHRLFDRGRDFVATTTDGTLAGWAFTYLLELVEDLGQHHVEIDGQEEPLMRREPLREITLDLLETYLTRGEHDPLCLATARVHLAAALRQRNRYSARDAERLDALSFSWASELVQLPTDLPGPAPEALHLDAAGAITWLEEYAQRSDWGAIEEEAAARLDPGWIERVPSPTIVGRALIPDRMHSPAWHLLAFAAPAGFEWKTPFAVVIHSAGESPVAIHALVCDPLADLVVEVWQRSVDGVWHERRYGPVTRRAVERLSPGALPREGKVSTYASVDELADPVRQLVPLLVTAAAALE